MDSQLSEQNMQGFTGRRLRVAFALAAALCAVTLGNRSFEDADLPVPAAQPGSLIAVADLHGDVDKAIQALQLVSIVDQHGRWIARHVTVVQLGDLADRGPSSLGVIKYMHNLQDQALQHQSQLVLLLGNHELMNLNGDFRYVASEELINLGRQQQQQQTAATTSLSSQGIAADSQPVPPATSAVTAYDAHITTAAAYSTGLEMWAALWSKAAVQQQAVHQPLERQIAAQETAAQQAVQQPSKQQVAVQESAVQEAVQQSADTQLAAAQEGRQAGQQSEDHMKPASQSLVLQEGHVAAVSNGSPLPKAAAAAAVDASQTAQPATATGGAAAAAYQPQPGSVRASIAARHQLIAVHGIGRCRTAFVHAGLIPQALHELLLLSSSTAASAYPPTALRYQHQHMPAHDGLLIGQLDTAAAAAAAAQAGSSSAAAAAVQGSSSRSSDSSALVGVVTAEELQAVNQVVQRALSSCEGRTCLNGPPLLQQAMALLSSADGPVWTRQQAQGHESRVCGHLEQVLQQLAVQRLVVGHTPQSSGRAAVRCGGRLLLLDTGMSSGMMDSTAAAWICQDGNSSSSEGIARGSAASIAHDHSSRSSGQDDSTAGQQTQGGEWKSIVVYADGRRRAV